MRKQGHYRADHAPHFRPKRDLPLAFTLIELLVVIAIIGILAGLLLPVLTRAKSSGLSAACLSNLKQLQVCFHLYAMDNADVVPPNNFIYDINTDTPIDQGSSWCTNLAPFDINPAGIEKGMLFQYNASDGIYHCPADKSTVETRDGASLGQLRLRSYNMSQSINGYPGYDPVTQAALPSFRTIPDIRAPDPTRCFVFLDVHENEILDTEFGIPTGPGANQWWDVPANRHNQGCNFSFADGHVEHWKWKMAKNVTVPRGSVQPVDPGEGDDYARMQRGFRQNFN
jgi:prepilin-type processing-associated H-X9-DG protein/prepilin-type N-terminal cleavage/methylation domain-containing protein